MTAVRAPSGLLEDEHITYRDSVRAFLEREVLPGYETWRNAGRIPREVLAAAGDHGFIGMQVPEEHGGSGVDDVRFGAIVGDQAMHAGLADLALVLTTHTDAAVPVLVHHAPPERRAHLLPGLASGEVIATVADGDVTARGGRGGVRLSGAASFVVAGADADVLVVPIGSDEVALVERRGAGVALTPATSPVGLAAAGFADLVLDEAPALLLGADAARRLRVDHALSIASTALAGARTALAATAAYVRERRAFGQPVAGFENTRHELAEVSAQITGADAFLAACIGERLVDALDASRACSLKLVCCDAFARAADTGVQLHGGYGYIMEYPIARAYVDALFWRLGAGARDDLHDLVAGALLG